MRIVSGELGGRIFEQPDTRSVRPLSEKVRAALFDVTGPVVGLTVLDAYAGSGAAGFEAISRGALLVDAIEANARVAKTIRKNVISLNFAWGYVLHQVTVETWLASPQHQAAARRYDLIIADPPYAEFNDDVIERLVEHLSHAGVLAVSHTSKITPQLTGAVLIQHKVYGDTALSFYRAVT